MATDRYPHLSTFQKEPARIIGYFASLASLIIVLLIQLGIAVPDGLDQTVQNIIQTVGTILVILIPMIQANVTRQKVVPVAKVPNAEEGVPYVPAAVDSAATLPVQN